MTVKTIYEDKDVKLKKGEGSVLITLSAWGHRSFISIEIWERLVRAWLKHTESFVVPGGEVWGISKDRLHLFLAEAEALSAPRGSANAGFVKLRKVKELLFNLALGRAPDEPRPPSWSGKDVVGYLMRRGWEITSDGEGMQRRGFFIPAEAIKTAQPGGSESTADELESEAAQRTDRQDRRDERPGNGCIECRHQTAGTCGLSVGDPQVVPHWCPLIQERGDR